MDWIFENFTSVDNAKAFGERARFERLYVRSFFGIGWTWKKKIANRPIEGLVSTDRSMVAALLNTTPRPVTKSSANDSTPRP